MRLATLSIGDELLAGEIVDSNAAAIARELRSLGLAVSRHLTVGDGEAEIAAALLELAAQHQVVIASGGLGPTSDDRTTAGAARAAGCELALEPAALALTEAFFLQRGLPYHSANAKQALLPASSTLLVNRHGTASGFALTIGSCRCFFLPGVPPEMTAMLAEEVLPQLADPATAGCRPSWQLRTFGLPEPRVEELVSRVLPAAEGLEIAYCAVFPEVFVRLRCHGSSPAAAQEQLATAVARARQALGEWLVAEQAETLEERVAALLKEQRRTLATAESCSAGLLAKRLTDPAGSSAYFLGGTVSYSNAAKTSQLGVDPELLACHGAVSTAVAAAMADGCRQRFASDLALAVTGIAGPDGGSADKPVGTVFLALASAHGTVVHQRRFNGDRAQVRELTAATALDLLRRELLGIAAAP